MTTSNLSAAIGALAEVSWPMDSRADVAILDGAFIDRADIKQYIGL